MNEREPLEAWENELHEELRALPDLKAPPSLIPGVLHRLPSAAAAPGGGMAWWLWPPALRIASAALVLGVLAALAWACGSFLDLGLGQGLVQAHADARAALAVALNQAESILGPNAAFWHRYGQMILIASATLLVGIYLAGIAAGSALYRLAWRRIS